MAELSFERGSGGFGVLAGLGFEAYVGIRRFTVDFGCHHTSSFFLFPSELHSLVHCVHAVVKVSRRVARSWAAMEA